MRLSKLLAVTLISAGAWTSANATLITSADAISGPVDVIDFSDHAEQEITLGPVQIGNLVGRDVTFTAVSDYGVAGFSGVLFGNGRNGTWDQTMNGYAMVAGENPSSPLTRPFMRFTFNDGPVSAVGGFMNYCISNLAGAACDGAYPILRALDSSLNIIEIYDLTGSAPIRTQDARNAGEFRGIVRETADIYAFDFMGIGTIDNLTFSAAPANVPEPATNALLALGLGMMILSRRRSRVTTRS